jgi:hypothetical protein
MILLKAGKTLFFLGNNLSWGASYKAFIGQFAFSIINFVG